MLSLQKVTNPDSVEVEILAALANEIWHEHFVTILSMEQIEYMVDKFQSVPAIRRQLREEGYVYYLAYEDTEPVAYCAIVPKPEQNALFLSKLYVKKSHRKKGIARQLFSHALTDGPRGQFQQVYLTCNKNNKDSLAVYRHMGFTITDSAVTPIGNGMVMDDYILTAPCTCGGPTAHPR